MKRIASLLALGCLGSTSFLSAAEPGRAAGTGESFKGPLGLQLYSLRDYFSKDVPGTLAKVNELGFRTVELAGTYGKSPAEFTALLAAKNIMTTRT